MTWLLSLLTIFSLQKSDQLDLSSRAFRTLQQREGTYHLVNGTQGCPNEISWEIRCQGVVLFNHDSQSSLPFRNEFCDVNRPSKTFQQIIFRGRQTLKIQTTFQDQILKKTEHQSYRSRPQKYHLESNQLLILDAGDSFMWERDHLGSGTSCLYRK